MAHLMVGYCELGWRAWSEHLHEVLNGYQMSAYMIQKPVLLDDWVSVVQRA